MQLLEIFIGYGMIYYLSDPDVLFFFAMIDDKSYGQHFTWRNFPKA